MCLMSLKVDCYLRKFVLNLCRNLPNKIFTSTIFKTCCFLLAISLHLLNILLRKIHDKSR